MKCSWLSNMLSGFSCLASCVKMPLCSAPGCSNGLDKYPEKSLSFHNLSFSKNVGKKVAGPASSGCTFYDQNLRMSTLVMNTSQRIVTKSVTDPNVGWDDKRRLKQAAVPKIFQRKVPLKPHISSKCQIAQRKREEVSVTFSLVQQQFLI